MVYDIPWTPAPNNKLLTIADVYQPPTIQEMIQLAAFQNSMRERRAREQPSAARAESAEEQPAPTERTGEQTEAPPERPWDQASRSRVVATQARMPTIMDLIDLGTRGDFDTTRPWGSARPDAFTIPPDYVRTLPYHPGTDTATRQLLPYDPATDTARMMPLRSSDARRPAPFHATSFPVPPERRASMPQGSQEPQRSRRNDYLTTGLKMMESDNPAAMKMGLPLLRGINGAGGSGMDLPESLPDSGAYTDLARGIRSIMGDGSLDPARRVEAFNTLSARVRGQGEEAARSFDSSIDMSAIEAELARRGVL
jgi:hypothetical protein